MTAVLVAPPPADALEALAVRGAEAPDEPDERRLITDVRGRLERRPRGDRPGPGLTGLRSCRPPAARLLRPHERAASVATRSEGDHDRLVGCELRQARSVATT